MQSLTSPFFFLTTTIGEEKSDSDSWMTSASRSCWRWLRTASISWGCIGLGLCLNVVSSLRVMWCFILSVRPKSSSCSANTSGMELNFSVILSFHSLGTGESAKSRLRFYFWSGFVGRSESGVSID